MNCLYGVEAVRGERRRLDCARQRLASTLGQQLSSAPPWTAPRAQLGRHDLFLQYLLNGVCVGLGGAIHARASCLGFLMGFLRGHPARALSDALPTKEMRSYLIALTGRFALYC